MHSFLVFLFRTPPSLVEYVMKHPEKKRNISMFESLDIQTAAEVRYLDPYNMPKTASEEVFGCLGNANFPMFQSSLNDYSTYSYRVTGERLVVCTPERFPLKAMIQDSLKPH